MSYAWQQLQGAVRILATSSDRRERLIGAYGKLVKLKSRDLPAEAVADFSRLVADIPRYPAKNISREIKAAVASLSDEEVAKAIDLIFAMHDALAVYQPNSVHYSAWGRRQTVTLPAWPMACISPAHVRKAGVEAGRVISVIN
jgi:hypothetical protein